jgi:hypothetical protein
MRSIRCYSLEAGHSIKAQAALLALNALNSSDTHTVAMGGERELVGSLALYLFWGTTLIHYLVGSRDVFDREPGPKAA